MPIAQRCGKIGIRERERRDSSWYVAQCWVCRSQQIDVILVYCDQTLGERCRPALQYSVQAAHDSVFRSWADERCRGVGERRPRVLKIEYKRNAEALSPYPAERHDWKRGCGDKDEIE